MQHHRNEDQPVHDLLEHGAIVGIPRRQRKAAVRSQNRPGQMVETLGSQFQKNPQITKKARFQAVFDPGPGHHRHIQASAAIAQTRTNQRVTSAFDLVQCSHCTSLHQSFTKKSPRFHKVAKATKTSTGRWHIQIQIAGVRDSGTFATKREADAWAQQRAVELRAAKAGKSGTVKTLRDALREYAERVTPAKRGWVKELVRLKAFEGPGHHALPINKRLSDVTAGDIALWRDARLKVNARGTVLRDLTLLSAVLEIARREWGWVDANVCRDVTRPANPDHREVIIHGPQIRRMLRQLGWSRKPARSVSGAIANCFLLALQTGARAGELCAMRWADVRSDYMTVDGKTGKRDVPLTPASRRTIELMRGFDDVLVFGLKSQSLDALFRRARTRAGMSGFTYHDSRHTAATRLAQRLHVLDLCKMFGWSNPKMAMVYYNPKASDIVKRLR